MLPFYLRAGSTHFKRKGKHAQLFICKTERRRETSTGVIHSSHRVLIGRKAAPAAAGEDYSARGGGCKGEECTYTHNSDTDTKTRDPVRALNNGSTVKLMLGEVYSSGLSGGHAIHMSAPAGEVEEEAECRDGGVTQFPIGANLLGFVWCVCVCV